VELSSNESIAILTFPEHPEYPRLSPDILAELRERLRAIQSAACFEGLVIAANSRSFATGARIEDVSRLSGVGAFDFARLGQAVLQEVARSPIPIVAAIRGFCLGGGLDLALASGSRVAAYDASFGYPGAGLGLLTGWGGTGRLPRLVGRGQALQMFVTGERVPATQALTLGLVEELVSSADLIASAARRARRMAVEAGLTRPSRGVEGDPFTSV